MNNKEKERYSVTFGYNDNKFHIMDRTHHNSVGSSTYEEGASLICNALNAQEQSSELAELRKSNSDRWTIIEELLAEKSDLSLELDELRQAIEALQPDKATNNE